MRKSLLLFFVLGLLLRSGAQTWTTTSEFSNPVNSHTVTVLTDSTVINIGGNKGFQDYSSDVNVYNVYTDTWTAVTSYPTNIENHKAVKTSDSTILVIGGSVDGASTDAVYSYNWVEDEWTAKASIPKKLESLSVIALTDTSILATAGWNLPAYSCNAEAYIYNTVAETWRTVASVPEELNNSIIAKTTSGDAIVAGGLNSSFSTSPSTYLYNAEADEWTKVGDLPYAISGGALCATMPLGEVIAVGGFDIGSFSYMDKVVSFNESDSTWVTLFSLDYAIANAAFAPITDDVLLLAGGSNSSKGYSFQDKMTIHTLNGNFSSGSKAVESKASKISVSNKKAIAEEALPSICQAPAYTKLNDNRVFISGGAGETLAEASLKTAFIYEKSFVQVSSTVEFTVIDQNSDPIIDATVMLGDSVKTTDDNGKVSILALEGIYGYSVTKSNYDTAMVLANDTNAIVIDGTPVALTITLTETVGVTNEMAAKNISIYPTLTSGKLNVVNNNDEPVSVYVFNQLGQNVFTHKNIIGRESIILNQKTGIYFVSVVNKQGLIKTEKVMIK